MGQANFSRVVSSPAGDSCKNFREGQMHADELGTPPERDIAIARLLVEAIADRSQVALSKLDELYSAFHVGRSFWGRHKMSGAIAKKTRHALIVYVTALTRLLMENWQHRTDESDSILRLVEEALLSSEGATARPAYDYYVARYKEHFTGGPTALSREGLVHAEFTQMLTISVWSFWRVCNTPRSGEYSQRLWAITRTIEADLRTVLNGLWPAPQRLSPCFVIDRRSANAI